MEIIINVIFSILGGLVILGTAIYIYNLSIDESDLLFQSRNADLLSFKNKVILSFAYIGFFMAFYGGTQACLSWLPDSWGTIDDGGEFITLENTLSGLLGFLAASFTIGSLEKNYRFRLASLLKNEEIKYREMINNQWTNRTELESKLKEHHKYQQELIQIKRPVSDGRYRFISQEKELIYRRLLKSMEDNNHA